MNYRIISADDHIDMQWLPRDLWQKRVPGAWRERAPRVIETDAGPYWVCGDERWDPWGGREGGAGGAGGRAEGGGGLHGWAAAGAGEGRRARARRAAPDHHRAAPGRHGSRRGG